MWMHGLPSKRQGEPLIISCNGISVVMFFLLLSARDIITGTITLMSAAPNSSLSSPRDRVSNFPSSTKGLAAGSVPLGDDVINPDCIPCWTGFPVGSSLCWKPWLQLTELFTTPELSVRKVEGLSPGERHRLGDFVLSAGTLVSLGLPPATLAVDTDNPLSASDAGGCLKDIWKTWGILMDSFSVWITVKDVPIICKPYNMWTASSYTFVITGLMQGKVKIMQNGKERRKDWGEEGKSMSDCQLKSVDAKKNWKTLCSLFLLPSSVQVFLMAATNFTRSNWVTKLEF